MAEPGKMGTRSEERKKLLLVLASVVIVASALCWSLRTGLRANRDEHELGHVTDALTAMRTEIRQLEAKQR